MPSFLNEFYSRPKLNDGILQAVLLCASVFFAAFAFFKIIAYFGVVIEYPILFAAFLAGVALLSCIRSIGMAVPNRVKLAGVVAVIISIFICIMV